MGDQQARSALARGLHARVHEFESGGDELRVLDAVATRLALGRERHGILDLAKSRDWVREMDEELIDWLVYHACKRLSDRDAKVAAIAGADEADTGPLDRVEVGLAELRNAPAIERSATDIDTAELGGEGG